MKRRDFLKILGVAPVVAVVPLLAKTDTINRQLSDAKTLRSHPKGTAQNYLGLKDPQKIPNTPIYQFGETTTESEGVGLERSGLQAKLNGKIIPMSDCLAEAGGLTSPVYAKAGDNVTFTTEFMKL